MSYMLRFIAVSNSSVTKQDNFKNINSLQCIINDAQQQLSIFIKSSLTWHFTWKISLDSFNTLLRKKSPRLHFKTSKLKPGEVKRLVQVRKASEGQLDLSRMASSHSHVCADLGNSEACPSGALPSGSSESGAVPMFYCLSTHTWFSRPSTAFEGCNLPLIV